MSEKQQNIGKSTLNGTPDRPLKFVIKEGTIKERHLADGSIGTSKLQDKAVTEDKLADDAITMEKLPPELPSLILQSVISDLKRVWDKIGDITGERLQDLSFAVTPKYFVSEEGVRVHISASSVGNNAIFDHIAFYINGKTVVETSGVEILEFDTVIYETSEIKYKATVMGTEYTASETVVHYNSYWLGAGRLYTDIVTISHIIPIVDGMRGQYDVTFQDDDKFFIVLGKQLRDQFIRADMNGFEIPFDEYEVIMDDKEYVVLESSNSYVAGTYNIDING